MADRCRPSLTPFPPSPPRPAMRPASRWLAVCLCAAAALSSLIAREVQQHGLVFEQWIRTTFFDSYQPSSYTQKWDIPAAVNRAHGGVPVNPKAAKYGGPVDLGDALRQFDIAEPFLLVIGYWEQAGDTKRFVHIIAPRIEPALWRQLWGPVTASISSASTPPSRTARSRPRRPAPPR